MRLIGLSEAPSKDGERDNGMENAAEEENAKDVCGTQEQSKLPRELPPEEEVGCAREEPSVAGSPREVALPKPEGTRQPRSRRSRNRCKAKRKVKTPSHKDEEGTETQQKAKGNGSHGHERSPRRQGQLRGKSDRGGHSCKPIKWGRLVSREMLRAHGARKEVHYLSGGSVKSQRGAIRLSGGECHPINIASRSPMNFVLEGCPSEAALCAWDVDWPSNGKRDVNCMNNWSGPRESCGLCMARHQWRA
ncbi:hypothetical protein GH714_019675 [Hevea brasiliensis]|uniref:Uncharacterized protein n=1 Tax=Hevea brasiliensis TaxID=3981 RepID=A0A6A6LTX6_HEVBR|nr:hypothetical protein GH714_019675 [Hevea brasiliensis]